MGTLAARPLWAPGIPQGQQRPKDFDDWFYGLEHCVCWLSGLWHSSPTLLVSGEYYFGDRNLALTELGGLSQAHSSHWKRGGGRVICQIASSAT